MKYKAKKFSVNKEEWAVFSGSKFFSGTIGTKKEAEEKAIEMSMHWYYAQALEAFDKLVKINPDVYENKCMADCLN